MKDYTTLQVADAPQHIIVELMRLYYKEGWVSGTGGGISIREGDKVFIAPSGVHKERLQEKDIYILDANDHNKIYYNPNDASQNSKACYKVSACQPLFYLCYNIRNAGAVIHSHALNAVMATLLFEGKNEFKITHIEMIKGIRGYGYHDELVVPIIENTAYENELEDSMREAILKYPNTFAVLVRRHGVYIWGKDWVEAKTHAEVYHYLFETAVKMKYQLGLDVSQKPKQ